MFKPALLLLALLTGSLFACALTAVQTAHLTTHGTTSTTVFGTFGCSATAIGPHALLTASHCEAPVSVITVDDVEYTIVGTPMRDGFDHTIYILSGAEFAHYASFSTEDIAVADDLFIFGNPANLEDIFRRGYVCVVSKSGYLVDMNGFFGDSGAALFNTKGQIVGIVSALTQKVHENATMKLMIAYKLAFTAAQIKTALESK